VSKFPNKAPNIVLSRHAGEHSPETGQRGRKSDGDPEPSCVTIAQETSRRPTSSERGTDNQHERHHPFHGDLPVPLRARPAQIAFRAGLYF